LLFPFFGLFFMLLLFAQQQQQQQQLGLKTKSASVGDISILGDSLHAPEAEEQDMFSGMSPIRRAGSHERIYPAQRPSIFSIAPPSQVQQTDRHTVKNAQMR
jgi:hypothetical protein